MALEARRMATSMDEGHPAHRPEAEVLCVLLDKGLFCSSPLVN